MENDNSKLHIMLTKEEAQYIVDILKMKRYKENNHIKEQRKFLIGYIQRTIDGKGLIKL